MLDVIIVGNALNSWGFVGSNFSVQGLGLNTWGFLWPCDGIWNSDCADITTTWECVIPPGSTTETCID